MSLQLPEKVAALIKARALVARLTEEVQKEMAEIGITAPWAPVVPVTAPPTVLQPKRSYVRRAAPVGAHVVAVPDAKKHRRSSKEVRMIVAQALKAKMGATEVAKKFGVNRNVFYKHKAAIKAGIAPGKH